MILTVTPDPVLDKILMIDEWTPGIPMQVRKSTTSVGGKGLDSSVVLTHLGVETVGLTFLAGRTGESLLPLIKGYGIIIDPIWVDGETRTAYVVSEIKNQRHSHLFTGGLLIKESQREMFMDHYKSHLKQSSWVICGGVIPPVLPLTFYRTITELANDAGVPVLIDAFQDFVREALPAGPAIIKMNCLEFEWTFKVRADSLEALKSQAARIFQDRKLNALVITCEEEGILAYTSHEAFHSIPPKLEVVNATGAGDAASATLVWRLSAGDGWYQALRWATAVSAAVVLTEGTADCRMEDIRNIYPQVKVKRL